MRNHDPLTFAALTEAMLERDALCAGDERYTADELSTREQIEMSELCALCPLLAACRAYSVASRPSAGYYAGVKYPTHTRRATQ